MCMHNDFLILHIFFIKKYSIELEYNDMTKILDIIMHIINNLIGNINKKQYEKGIEKVNELGGV